MTEPVAEARDSHTPVSATIDTSIRDPTDGTCPGEGNDSANLTGSSNRPSLSRIRVPYSRVEKSRRTCSHCSRLNTTSVKVPAICCITRSWKLTKAPGTPTDCTGVSSNMPTKPDKVSNSTNGSPSEPSRNSYSVPVGDTYAIEYDTLESPYLREATTSEADARGRSKRSTRTPNSAIAASNCSREKLSPEICTTLFGSADMRFNSPA